jgi:hypothetical protein
LQLTQGHEQGHFLLLGQAEVQLLFGAALEEGVDDFVEVLGDFALEGELVLLRALEELDAVLDAHEHVLLVEDFGHDEVEQAPELLEVVVERSAGEQQAEGGLELVEGEEALGFIVFDLVRLVDDQRLPLYARQRRVADLRPLVVGDDDVELPRLQNLLQKILPRLNVEDHQFDLGAGEPFGELPRPIASY